MLWFHLDEHIDPAIADGLRRRGVDVTTTLGAGLRGAADEEHVAFARAQGRVIVTQDSDFLRISPSGGSTRGYRVLSARSTLAWPVATSPDRAQ